MPPPVALLSYLDASGTRGHDVQPHDGHAPSRPAPATQDADNCDSSVSSQQQLSLPLPQAQPVAGNMGKHRRKATSRRPTDVRGLDQNANGSDVDPETLEIARHATPEAIMEVKRRKAAFRVMLRLVESDAPDTTTLTHMCAALSGDEFLQVAEERSLAGKCGNALCTASVSIQRAQGPRWHASEDKVVRQTEPLCCSSQCSALVASYAKALGNPMQRMKSAAKEKFLVSHRPKTRSGQPQQEVAAQVNGVTTMLAHIEERTVDLPPRAPHPETADSRAVEGYVPGTATASGFSSATVTQVTQLTHVTQRTRYNTDPQPVAAPASSQRVTGGTGGPRAAPNLVLCPADKFSASDSSGCVGSPAPQPSNSSGDGDGDTLRDRVAACVAGQVLRFVDDIGVVSPSTRGVAGTETQCTTGRGGGSCDVPFDGPCTASASAASTSRSILKAPGQRHLSGSKGKKSVRWADELVHEHVEDQQAGNADDTPVLVFTVEDDNAVTSAAAGGRRTGTRGSGVLAGRLELRDASRLSCAVPAMMMKQQQAVRSPLPTLYECDESDGTGGLTLQGNKEDSTSARAQDKKAGRPQTPRVMSLLLPPSAGGLGVPVTRAPVANGGAGGTSKPRKFSPRVPNRTHQTVQPDLASSRANHQISSRANHQVSSRKHTDHDARSHSSDALQPSESTPLHARDQADGAASVKPVKSIDGVMRGDKVYKIGRDSSQSKVIMLDTPALPRSTQRRPGPMSNRSSKRANGRGADTALTCLLPDKPAPEVLPFEESDPLSTSDMATNRNGIGGDGHVRVIKSDGLHAVVARGHKIDCQFDNVSSDSEEEGDSLTCAAQRQEAPLLHAKSAPRTRPHGPSTPRRPATATTSPPSYDIPAGLDERDRNEEVCNVSEDTDEGSDSDDQDRIASAHGRGHGNTRRISRTVINQDTCREDIDEAGDGEQDDAHREYPLDESDAECDSVDESDAEEDKDGAFQAAVPFFGPPPKGYRVELSPFNMLWSLLSSWVTRETLQFMLVEGGWGAETMRGSRDGILDGPRDSAARVAQDDEADAVALVALPPPSMRSAQARTALAELLLPHVVYAVQGMQARVDMGEVRKQLTNLIRTFVFVCALPSLSAAQWRLLSVAVLRALSIKRLPSVADAFERTEGSRRLAELLLDTGFELPHLSALVDLLLSE